MSSPEQGYSRKQQLYAMARSVSLLVLCLTVWTGPVRPSYACSCDFPNSVAEQLSRAGYAFSGEVVSVDTIRADLTLGQLKVTFAVHEVWKGRVTKEFVVWTWEDPASCGFNDFSLGRYFEIGRDYVVYAHEPGSFLGIGGFFVGLCDWNKRSEEAAEDLEVLGPGYDPLETIADTLVWRDYLPLQVGNTWEYEEGNTIFGTYPDRYERRQIIADTSIGVHSYFVHRTQSFDASLHVLTSNDEYLRYDATRRAVVSWIQTDTSSLDKVWPEAGMSCDLSAAFGSTIFCNGEVVVVEGGYVTEHEETWPNRDLVRAWKEFGISGTGMTVFFINGSGDWGYTADWEMGFVRKLIYLRLDGMEYGESVVATSIDDEDTLPRSVRIIATYPNPITTSVAVEYEVDRNSATTLGLYNALGQRVYHLRMGPSAHGHYKSSIDVASVAQGVYFLLLQTDRGESHVRRVVVAR